jgi:hypothetical protein
MTIVLYVIGEISARKESGRISNSGNPVSARIESGEKKRIC